MHYSGQVRQNRVVITGFGLVTSLGRTVSEFDEALFAGRSAIGPIEGLKCEDPRFCLGGQIHDFDFKQEMGTGEGLQRLLRFSQFSMVAVKRAIDDALLPLDTMDRNRIGTSFGTAVAGLGETVHVEANRYFKRGDHGVSPMAWAEFTPCACTTHVAIHFTLRGPNATHSSGCVTGVDAIIWGAQQIRAGDADVMVVGGADAPFFPFIWAGLYRSGILAPMPDDGGSIPRPFSHDHSGIALVEGGSAMILESESFARARGAHIYGELLGMASVEEALPITHLDETGEAFALTMQRALDDAGLPPEKVDWVLAHGTGFPAGDTSESRGIETGLGRHAFCVPVSSIRGAVGQSFASGGGFQAAAACMAIKRQVVPPTLNFTRPADGCRLDYVPNVARVSRVQRVLINSAGVGGTHTCLVIGQYEGTA